ncbi:hypothetical protein ABVL58_10340, partial [Streptococcus infantarius]|uniref:hypothetical protein n=1 Tax=Streptococcus infantarius TaxID=102684 RepID=UPI00336AC004
AHSIIASLITILKLAICVPCAICIMIKLNVKHTVIDGHPLYIDGTPTQLFLNLIKWLNLTVITLAIYSYWLNIKLEQSI